MTDLERLKALSETALLDEEPQESLDRFTRIARNALGVPVVLVSLVDIDRQFFTSALGLPSPWAERRQTPLSHSFCKHVVGSRSPLVIADARDNELVRDNLAVTELGVIAYAGFPIVSEDAHVLGSFCAIDDKEHRWSASELALLEDIAKAASEQIDLRRRAVRASLAEASLSRTIDELLEAQSRASSAAATFRHDLRSPLQVIDLGLLALKKTSDVAETPQVKRALELMKRSVDHAVSIVNFMKHPDQRNDGCVTVAEVATEVVQSHHGNTRGIVVELARADAEACVHMDATNLRRCIENLVSNAIRFARGAVRVECLADLATVRVTVDDDGDGLPDAAAYREVWKSGVTYHAADGRSGTGLGLNIVQLLVEQAGGSATARRGPLGGAHFEVALPRL